MSTILELKAARRRRVAELVAAGMTNTEAWEAVADLTGQIHAARAAGAAETVTLTASAELAAKMMAKEVRGLSIREEDLPPPLPARAHTAFHESKTHPGVVWPL